MIGFIGLGIMGENLIKNFGKNGKSVFIYNRSPEKVDRFLSENSNQNFFHAKSIEEMCAKLPAPRTVMIMVKAGKPVDLIIEKMLPHLSAGDIVIDCGNSFYKDAIRRYDQLKKHGIHFSDVGISGGSRGALNGVSLMIGAEYEIYNKLYSTLSCVAEQNPAPCIERMGPVGVGHFVKMVHNGIEYGIMQILAEIVSYIRYKTQIPLESIGEMFDRYNSGELGGFLIEELSHILKFKENGEYLVNMVLDIANDKGTGRWTVIEGIQHSVPMPTISAALNSRFVSMLKSEREKLASRCSHIKKIQTDEIDEKCIEKVLYLSFVLTFEQGLRLIQAYSKEHDLKIDLKSVLSVWRGGCIIRMNLLNTLINSLKHSTDGMLHSDKIFNICKENILSFQKIISDESLLGVPMPALSATLQYIYSMTEEISSAQIIQALRDKFGVHSFQRLDCDGVYHAKWE